MISERTLRRWRKEALKGINPDIALLVRQLIESQKEILRMTQELLDQHLMKKK